MMHDHRKIDRRRFLTGTLGIAVGGFGLQACTADKLVSRSLFSSSPGDLFDPPKVNPMTATEEEIIAEIEGSLPFLQLDGPSILEFARELIRAREIGDMKPSYWLDLQHRFLLSSDFFTNGADESKVVKYVFFYDPYLTPCYNPFASPPPAS